MCYSPRRCSLCCSTLGPPAPHTVGLLEVLTKAHDDTVNFYLLKHTETSKRRHDHAASPTILFSCLRSSVYSYSVMEQSSCKCKSRFKY